jgi:RNA polymerase sigma factor (TIGR02999 family)
MEPLGEVSQLLELIHTGDRLAETKLLEILYADLRRIAAYHLSRERPDHSLQPTALVHEVYVRVFGSTRPVTRNRGHFMALAARVMRRLLVDRARTRNAEKRGRGLTIVPLEGDLPYHDDRSEEFLAVHAAIERLREWAPRQSQIVEMRFFAGMEEEEIADYLSVSSRTVKRDWAMARAWLHAELSQ